RERVRQAYYRQRQAEVLWLPSLQAATTYQRHDGLVQNALGLVFPTSKYNFFLGGGAVMRFEVADALFGPLVTRRLTAAQAASARATPDDVPLDVALTYLDLVEVHGQLAINAETLANAEDMLQKAEAAEAVGAGKTPADAPRARTEVRLRRVERKDLEARAG